MRFNEQLSRHMARGSLKRGAQCNRIDCIGLRPALITCTLRFIFCEIVTFFDMFRLNALYQ